MRTAAGLPGSLIYTLLAQAHANTPEAWNALDYFDAARLAPNLLHTSSQGFYLPGWVWMEMHFKS
jgi:hypothetical protein